MYLLKKNHHLLSLFFILGLMLHPFHNELDEIAESFSHFELNTQNGPKTHSIKTSNEANNIDQVSTTDAAPVKNTEENSTSLFTPKDLTLLGETNRGIDISKKTGKRRAISKTQNLPSSSDKDAPSSPTWPAEL